MKEDYKKAVYYRKLSQRSTKPWRKNLFRLPKEEKLPAINSKKTQAPKNTNQEEVKPPTENKEATKEEATKEEATKEEDQKKERRGGGRGRGGRGGFRKGAFHEALFEDFLGDDDD